MKSDRNQEKYVPGNGHKAAGSKNTKQSRLISFNPTESQKQTIKSDQRALEDVLASLEATLQDGHVLNIKYQEKYDAFSVIVREAGEDWQTALSLSVWHNSLDRAIRIMSYALTMVYPEFPLGVERMAFSDTDW
jgi:hypothetical protein